MSERDGSREVPRRNGTDAESPTDIPPPGLKEVAKRIVTELREDHVSLSAG